jgi:hypothetical protein
MFTCIPLFLQEAGGGQPEHHDPELRVRADRNPLHVTDSVAHVNVAASVRLNDVNQAERGGGAPYFGRSGREAKTEIPA